MSILERGMTPELIAIRIARELRDGMVVNIGVGIPILVAQFVPAGIDVLFHAENGMIGFGGEAEPGNQYFDADSVIFGGPKALLPGASVVDHAQSFAIVRGGHLDLAVLGGFQVSQHGDLANWWMKEMASGGIGGGPDIATHARRVIVAMGHVTRDGQPRLVAECSYPLTAPRCVDLVVTNCGVFQPSSHGLLFREIVPGLTVEEVQSVTDARLILADDFHELQL